MNYLRITISRGLASIPSAAALLPACSEIESESKLAGKSSCDLGAAAATEHSVASSHK